jgi:LPXTG-site transpeptidase (sortase) family protein
MSWRGPVSLVGTVLVLFGLGGFALLIATPKLPIEVVEPVTARLAGEVARVPNVATSPVTSSLISPGEPAVTHGPITRLTISSIDLDTRVAPAPQVDHDGTTTWDVPKFVAGHAEGTPGAGEVGNAILIGHVTSITLGNVFEHLAGVHSGDLIEVFSGQQAFDYRVTDIRSVSRSDVSVLEPTATPTVTLITCTGLWLPTVWDYTERLIVHAALEN